MANPEKMRIGKQDEKYVIENTPYAFHKKCRTKNYAAKITGADKTYGFMRVFLERIHKAYLLNERPKAGDIFEIHAEMWSWSGKTSSDAGGFYLLNTDGTFTEIKEDAVKLIFPAKKEEPKAPLNEVF